VLTSTHKHLSLFHNNKETGTGELNRTTNLWFHKPAL
jgi:hypothetical protein